MATSTIHDTIEHAGVIREITPGTIKINLLNVSGCTSCPTKNTCSLSEVDNKIIEVFRTKEEFSKGEMVTISIQKSLGPLALTIAYIGPFVFSMLIMMLAWMITINEVITGLAALISVGVYYLFLTFFRKNLKDTFTCNIHKR